METDRSVFIAADNTRNQGEAQGRAVHLFKRPALASDRRFLRLTARMYTNIARASAGSGDNRYLNYLPLSLSPSLVLNESAHFIDVDASSPARLLSAITAPF